MFSKSMRSNTVDGLSGKTRRESRCNIKSRRIPWDQNFTNKETFSNTTFGIVNYQQSEVAIQLLSYSIFASILSTNRVIEALKMNTLVWQMRQGLANLARTCVDLRPHAVIVLRRQLIIIRVQLHMPTFILLLDRPAFATPQPPATGVPVEGLHGSS